jgi:tricorn protease
MRLLRPALVSLVVVWGSFNEGQGSEPIRLANDPALSPDGSTLVFSWGGDLWSVPSAGGRAKPLTRHPSHDRQPAFSPDGKQIAFASDRQGSFHPYVMPAGGGAPRQVGFHSSGYAVGGWAPDGRGLLVSGPRDHFWRDADRFFLIRTDERVAEEPLFDAPGRNGALSPDGKLLLITREGAPWWRKGYKGSQDSQVWLYDLGEKTFTKVLNPSGGALWPLWRADGKGFYYVGLHKGALNLREHDLGSKEDRPLTEFDDDSVVFPCISRDGSTVVFRHLFDLFRIKPAEKKPAERIDILDDGDVARDPFERRGLSQASQVAFSRDGLEVAFVAGGDLWVMDTELKEPRQVTATPEEERDPVFSPRGDALLFVSDKGGQPDIWKAERADGAKDWWLNTKFKLDRLTDDPEPEADLKWSPEGSRVGFLKGRGDLWVMGADGKGAKRVLESWNAPRFDWSPDAKWLVYGRADDDFNEDIWIAPVDGSRPPFNLSRHPDNESDPVWSPDGKLIAFTGRRVDTEIDIFFVWLQEEEDEKSSRERTLAKALEKIKKARSKKGASPSTKGGTEGDPDKADDREKGKESEGATPTGEAKKPPKVVIDFDRIHERIRRIAVPKSTETNLFWSHDSKKLAFTGTVDGKTGVYTVEIPDDLTPKLLSTQVGTQPRWLEAGNQIVWLSSSVPASLSASGKETPYRFRALQEVDWPAKYRAAFDLCWRTMRDRWYDERLGNRNWDAVRRKYADMAAASPDHEAFAVVVQLMLGELNGSHLGFSTGVGAGRGPRPGRPAGGASPAERWGVNTAHFGLRFEPGSKHKGPGLMVRDVIPGSPADHRATRIEPGEVVLAVDGTPVDPALDLTRVLNGPIERDVRLTVRSRDGKEREVTLRPILFPVAQGLLYEKWVKDNRKAVEEQSKGTLGYLHIRGMDFPSFYRFEEELYSAGAGKAGLVIDVRENGGGSTTDHLLTALTQPAHAITVPRGGGPGYPQDRRVYATWGKPIVVLCNQNSFSNAEIFSHAIKTLKRGKLVGTQTAGGVISTGGTSIMDIGFLRLPARGWFVLDTGEDMELNGAVPDHTVWPDPADFARGRDAQLAKAVEVLLDDVKQAEQKPKPKLRKATERGDARAAGG